MTRMNHIGKFLVNMVADGEISVRAKVYQVGDNANPAHTTQVGAVVRIFRLGGPRGEKGDTGGISQSQAQAIADARIANYGIPFTDALAARLLTPFPATGSRDKKIQKFNGNVLGWVEDSGFTVNEVQALTDTLDTNGVPLPSDFRNYDILLVFVRDGIVTTSLTDLPLWIPISNLPTANNSIVNFGPGLSGNRWAIKFETRSSSEAPQVDRLDSNVLGISYVALIKF